MYDTLAMPRPDAAFSPEDLHRLLTDIAQGGSAWVQRDGDAFSLITDVSHIDLVWNGSDAVLDESNDLAARFSIPCQACHTRIEIAGDDDDMSLFNEYIGILERLDETGMFVLFDPVDCRLLP